MELMMVDDTIKEAAKRLRQSVPPDSVHEGIYASMDEMAADAVTVAVAYLGIELLLPVTRQWLIEIAGFETMDEDDLILRQIIQDGHKSYLYWERDVFSIRLVKFHCPLRCDVLELFSMLGIEI